MQKSGVCGTGGRRRIRGVHGGVAPTRKGAGVRSPCDGGVVRHNIMKGGGGVNNDCTEIDEGKDEEENRVGRFQAD